jgi:hypothetical protein
MNLPYAGQVQRERNITETPPTQGTVASEFRQSDLEKSDLA